MILASLEYGEYSSFLSSSTSTPQSSSIVSSSSQLQLQDQPNHHQPQNQIEEYFQLDKDRMDWCKNSNTDNGNTNNNTNNYTNNNNNNCTVSTTSNSPLRTMTTIDNTNRRIMNNKKANNDNDNSTSSSHSNSRSSSSTSSKKNSTNASSSSPSPSPSSLSFSFTNPFQASMITFQTTIGNNSNSNNTNNNNGKDESVRIVNDNEDDDETTFNFLEEWIDEVRVLRRDLQPTQSCFKKNTKKMKKMEKNNGTIVQMIKNNSALTKHAQILTACDYNVSGDIDTNDDSITSSSMSSSSKSKSTSSPTSSPTLSSTSSSTRSSTTRSSTTTSLSVISLEMEEVNKVPTISKRMILKVFDDYFADNDSWTDCSTSGSSTCSGSSNSSNSSSTSSTYNETYYKTMEKCFYNKKKKVHFPDETTNSNALTEFDDNERIVSPMPVQPLQGQPQQQPPLLFQIIGTVPIYYERSVEERIQSWYKVKDVDQFRLHGKVLASNVRLYKPRLYKPIDTAYSNMQYLATKTSIPTAFTTLKKTKATTTPNVTTQKVTATISSNKTSNCTKPKRGMTFMPWEEPKLYALMNSISCSTRTSTSVSASSEALTVEDFSGENNDDYEEEEEQWTSRHQRQQSKNRCNDNNNSTSMIHDDETDEEMIMNKNLIKLYLEGFKVWTSYESHDDYFGDCCGSMKTDIISNHKKQLANNSNSNNSNSNNTNANTSTGTSSSINRYSQFLSTYHPQYWHLLRMNHHYPQSHQVQLPTTLNPWKNNTDDTISTSSKSNNRFSDNKNKKRTNRSINNNNNNNNNSGDDVSSHTINQQHKLSPIESSTAHCVRGLEHWTSKRYYTSRRDAMNESRRSTVQLYKQLKLKQVHKMKTTTSNVSTTSTSTTITSSNTNSNDDDNEDHDNINDNDNNKNASKVNLPLLLSDDDCMTIALHYMEQTRASRILARVMGEADAYAAAAIAMDTITIAAATATTVKSCDQSDHLQDNDSLFLSSSSSLDVYTNKNTNTKSHTQTIETGTMNTNVPFPSTTSTATTIMTTAEMYNNFQHYVDNTHSKRHNKLYRTKNTRKTNLQQPIIVTTTNADDTKPTTPIPPRQRIYIMA